ncbi:MAG: ribonuclease R, partial [Gemmatimonadota bacterium]
PVGQVIKVLERAHPTIVGSYRSSQKLGYVVPQDPRMNRDIFIAPGDTMDAKDDDVVVVRITAYGDRKANPVGEIEKVLGPLTDPGVDVLAILYGHGLPLEFPPEVERAAQDVVRRHRESEDTAGRIDRTALHVFTIDPADAKDHDDALSVTEVSSGAGGAGDGGKKSSAGPGGPTWEVGIHIADVAHFVQPGSIIDVEALQRGTSVYLVDQVVPMLPHALSSDMCSLRPDEDRFAISLFVVLDREGRVRKHRFERTIIRSRQRLSYEDVEEVLAGLRSVDAPTDSAIMTLRALARTLREKRSERGSLDFDLPEARVVLGQKGEPVDIQKVVSLESHRLIENFMLLANELVAKETSEKKLPILFRVHEPPSEDRMESLRAFLKSVGHTLPKGKIRPKDLQNVLERVAGRPEESLVSTVILRSMSRARYSVERLGHFGLASSWYAHFTSPIRRYPDLVVHRIVTRALIEKKSLPGDWTVEEMASVAEHTSAREQVAQKAERDSIELKKIEFMKRHLGDEFSGTIAGVTAFGFFVLLDDFFVEGLVHVSSLGDDYYQFVEDEYSMVGERTGRRFRLADRVRVQVARVDKEERKIDFLFVEAISD